MDWKLIISDLQAAGFSQQQMATACGCSQANISELLRGKTDQPSYPIGEALRTMHKRHCRKEAKAA